MGFFLEIEILQLVGISIPIIGLLIEHFHFQGQLQERTAVLETKMKCLEGMEGDVREIKTKVNLFWGALEEQIPSILMKGNPIDENSELYMLLGKLKSQQISTTELKQLSSELNIEIKNETHSPGEKLAMIFTEALVKSKLYEDNHGTSDCSN